MLEYISNISGVPLIVGTFTLGLFLFFTKVRTFGVLAIMLSSYFFWTNLTEQPYTLQPFELISHYGFYAVAGLVFYMVFGAVWSIFKWNRLTKLNKTNYRETKEKFLKENNVSKLEDLNELQIETYEELVIKYQNLNVLDNKSKIMHWIMNWPDSLLYHLFVNLIKDLLDSIVRHLTGVFNKIALRNAQEYLEDMKTLNAKR